MKQNFTMSRIAHILEPYMASTGTTMSDRKINPEDDKSDDSTDSTNKLTLLEAYERQQIDVATAASIVERRKFLKIVGGIFASPFIKRLSENTASGAAGGIVSTQIYRHIDQQKQDHEKLRDSREVFINEILGGNNDINLVPSVNNPYSNLKGPTLASMTAIQKTIEFLDPASYRVVDFIRSDVSQVDGHIMLFGGPLANIYSRQIFGHAGTSPLLGLVNADVCCRFDNLFSCNDTRPQYSIIVDGKRHIPQPGHDFLLVTKLPNIFSQTYGLNENSIIIISGLHGYGTRSIESIFKNSKYIEEIHKKTKNIGPAWQVLFVVKRENEDAGSCVLRATSKAFPIQADFDQLKSKVEGKNFFIHRSDPCFESIRI